MQRQLLASPATPYSSCLSAKHAEKGRKQDAQRAVPERSFSSWEAPLGRAGPGEELLGSECSQTGQAAPALHLDCVLRVPPEE